LLGNLAVADPNDFDHAPLARLAGGLDVREPAEVGARRTQAGNDTVTFGHDVEDLVAPVGKGGTPGARQSLQAVERGGFGACAVRDEVVGEELRCRGPIITGDDPVDRSRVLVGRSVAAGKGRSEQTPDADERKFRECRLYKTAPVNNNLVLAYVGEHVLGMPRSY